MKLRVYNCWDFPPQVYRRQRISVQEHIYYMESRLRAILTALYPIRDTPHTMAYFSSNIREEFVSLQIFILKRLR